MPCKSKRKQKILYKVQEKRSKKAQWRNTYRYNPFTGKRVKSAIGVSKTRAKLYKKSFEKLQTILPEREFYKLRIVVAKKPKHKRRK